jgi:ubiquinone/menaquinone biosynthesis C-methylase UbiE
VSGPDRDLARRRYQRFAATYDRLAPFTRGLRRAAIQRLALQPGETVIDVACGTGLSFELLEDGVGPQGRLIGLDLSEAMLEQAKGRVAEHGWENVELVCGPVEEVEIPGPADAAVFVLTHDVLQSPTALGNVLGSLKPDGRIAIGSAKHPPRWNLPGRLYMRYAMGRYTTTRENVERPWVHLGELVPDLEVRPLMFGTMFLASGHARVG